MKSNLKGLWQNPNFTRLWIGETTSLFGSYITGFAFPVTAVLLLKASPAEMGLLVAAGTLPSLIFNLLAGVWVDRLPRRPILIICDVWLALLVGSVPLLFFLGWLTLPYLYVVSFLSGLLSVFFSTAYFAYVPTLVTREELVESNIRLEISNSVASVAGPTLAGLLVQLVTAPFALILDALSFLVSLICLCLIDKVEAVIAPPSAKKKVLHEIKEGLQRVLTDRLLRWLSASTALINFFGAMSTAVFTLFVLQELSLAPGELGIIMAGGSIGALLGAFLVVRLTKVLGVGRAMAGSRLLNAIFCLFIPCVTGPSLLMVCMLCFLQFGRSFTNPVYNVSLVSLRQAVTPKEMQGKVNASMRFLGQGVMPFGALAGGLLGEVIGLRGTLFIACIGGFAAFPIIFFSPVRKLTEISSLAEKAID